MEATDSKQVLLTGATGYVGGRLLSLLEQRAAAEGIGLRGHLARPLSSRAEYLVHAPPEQIAVFSRGMLDLSDVLPGFPLDVCEVFA